MSASGGSRAIIAALLANLGIAVTKFIAFLLTRSSSMLAERYQVPVTELRATGEHPARRLASLIAPIDYASVYLGLLQGIDPTPIEPIAVLKAGSGASAPDETL